MDAETLKHPPPQHVPTNDVYKKWTTSIQDSLMVVERWRQRKNEIPEWGWRGAEKKLAMTRKQRQYIGRTRDG